MKSQRVKTCSKVLGKTKEAKVKPESFISRVLKVCFVEFYTQKPTVCFNYDEMLTQVTRNLCYFLLQDNGKIFIAGMMY